MATKIISFLGKNKYHATTYSMNDQLVATQYFPAAVKAWFPCASLHVFLTNEAEQMHANLLEDELRKHALGAYFPVRIPSGQNEEEYWAIFSAITGVVEDNDELVFDITYSFRSLPFLIFLAVAYLRVVRKATVKAVLYGAWDARDATNVSPVFDLSRFIELLDWASETDKFITTGSGEGISRLVKHTDLLDDGSAVLGELTNALRFTRLDQSPQIAQTLLEWLDTFTFSNKPDRQPFELLLGRLKDTFRPIALGQVGESNDIDVLKQHYEIVAWNFQHGQILSAVTVAREWLISVICVQVNGSLTNRKLLDEKASKALSHLRDFAKNGSTGTVSDYAQRMIVKDTHMATLLGDAWTAVADLRNDLDHAGMTQNSRTLDQLISEAQNARWAIQAIHNHIW